MIRHIYAIRDNVSKSILGGVHIFPADAPAVRMFGDIAAAKDTMIAKHPADFDLLRLGSIDLENAVLLPNTADDAIVVLTGSAWKSMQDAANNGEQHPLALTR